MVVFVVQAAHRTETPAAPKALARSWGGLWERVLRGGLPEDDAPDPDARPAAPGQLAGFAADLKRYCDAV